MSVGAFKRNLVFSSLFLFSVHMGWAQGASTNTPATNSGGVISFTGTNTTPVVEGTVSTNKVETPPPPEVEGATNITTNLVPMKPKVDNSARLGAFAVIPNKNPFRLIKPEPEEVEEEEKPPPPVARVPVLKGILRSPNNVRALLKITPLGGGKSKYQYLPEGENIDGVTVVKIQPDIGTVEVMVKGRTYPLVLDSFKEIASQIVPVGKSGNEWRPSEGQQTESSKENTTATKPWEKPKTPAKIIPRPGELKTVPQRRPTSSHLQKPPESNLFELPAFNESVQRNIIDPEMIYTQREIIRGQLAPGTPTDFRR